MAGNQYEHPDEPALRNVRSSLRSVLGLRSPAGFILCGGLRLAWQLINPALPAATEDAAVPSPGPLTVLCLHDAGSGSREFSPLQSSIPAGTQVMLVDWPGHGKSDDLPQHQAFTLGFLTSVFQSILQFLMLQSETQPGPPVVLASGFSCAVAIRFAAENPGAIRGLILCQPIGLIPFDTARDAPTGTILPSTNFPPTALRGGSCLTMRRLRPGQAKADLSDIPIWIKSLPAPAKWLALRQRVLRPAFTQVIFSSEASIRASSGILIGSLTAVDCPVFLALSRDSHSCCFEDYLAVLKPVLMAPSHHKVGVFKGTFHALWEDRDRFIWALQAFIQALMPVATHQHSWLLAAVDWPSRDLNLWRCAHSGCSAEQVLLADESATNGPGSGKKH